MNSCLKYFSTCLLATAALIVGASPAWAQGADFTVLGNAAVTCTDGSIIGDVGTNQSPNDAPPGSVTLTTCPVTGTVHVGDGVAKQAFKNFLDTYADLAPTPTENCTLLGSTIPESMELSPGTYCTTAALTATDVTLTLNGAGDYIFKIGTSDTGYLEGTNFNVALIGGATACNVTWWVAEYATIKVNAGTSEFNGTILAGTAITTTQGTFNGDAFAQADVTITGTAVIGCEGRSRGGKSQSKCNQGVGNGPENCDPGNSNQDDFGSNPFTPPTPGSTRTNDELGGTPGDPGRLGNM